MGKKTRILLTRKKRKTVRAKNLSLPSGERFFAPTKKYI
jgi:hypothetical protein